MKTCFPGNYYEPTCQWKVVNKFHFLLGLCTHFSFPIKLGFFQPANFHTSTLYQFIPEEVRVSSWMRCDSSPGVTHKGIFSCH